MDTFAPTPFPFDRFRRIRFGTGRPACLHCGAPRAQRWGSFSGRRRYRCTTCHRTFSDFTGTQLAHLKLIDRWPGFYRCMLDSMTVRQAGRVLGVDKDTAFLWRHRLLAPLDASDCTLLSGAVALEETFFAHSEKGSRTLDRPPRRRRALHRIDITPVWVLVARDPAGQVVSGVVGPRRPDPEDLERILLPHLGEDVQLVSTIGHYGAPARMADRIGLTHQRADFHSVDLVGARRYVLDLRRWIRRFRGVATRYLANYLAWHRVLGVATGS